MALSISISISILIFSKSVDIDKVLIWLIDISNTPTGTLEMAPTIMKCSNERFVRKWKQEESNQLVMVKCVDQTLDDRTKRYLFKPWRKPEVVMDQEEFSAEVLNNCDKVRLQLFPTSCIN